MWVQTYFWKIVEFVLHLQYVVYDTAKCNKMSERKRSTIKHILDCDQLCVATLMLLSAWRFSQQNALITLFI